MVGHAFRKEFRRVEWKCPYSPREIAGTGRFRLMRLFVTASCALLAAVSVVAVGSAQTKKAKKATPKTVSKPVAEREVCARQENQFVTVDEFVRAKRQPKIPVSVEGYVVMASKTGTGALKMVLVDSVDHVLTAQDAVSQGAAGAIVIAEA